MMKKKFIYAILSAAMLTCSITAYAEPEHSQIAETVSENDVSEPETSDSESSGSETSDPEDSESETSESEVSLRDVISSISSAAQGIVPIKDFTSGNAMTFGPMEITVEFTSEWENADVIDYKISAGNTTDTDYTISDDKITIRNPRYSISYSFYISSITVEKDGKAITFNLNENEFGGKTSWTFQFISLEDDNQESPSVSGNDANYTESSNEDSSSNENLSSSTEEAAPVIKNVITGEKSSFTSTVDGVYIPDSIDGFAVKSSYETVCESADMTAGTPDSGRIVLYVCDNTDKQERTVFSEAAGLLGAKMITVIDVDMYHFISTECRTIRTLETPIEVTIALPDWAVRQGGNFSVLCVDINGNLLNLPDMDTDSKTLTVSTSTTGTFAIIAH